MRVAVSGHRGLPEGTARLVDRALRDALAEYLPDLTGLSCLADGADQIFARAVLDLGGRLEVIVPARRYRDALPDTAKPIYDGLCTGASAVHSLDWVESDSTAHQGANEYMVMHADLLLAVWDGKPARGHGGTADVVSYARSRDLPVLVIWPEGSTRG